MNKIVVSKKKYSLELLRIMIAFHIESISCKIDKEKDSWILEYIVKSDMKFSKKHFLEELKYFDVMEKQRKETDVIRKQYYNYISERLSGLG